jgi:hypothetical protein
MTVVSSSIEVAMIDGVPHLTCSGHVPERDKAIARKWAILGQRQPKVGK